MFRRKQPPDPPPPPTDPLLDLAMTWRGRAADLVVGNLRIGTPTHRRLIVAAEARTYMHAASELEHALEET